MRKILLIGRKDLRLAFRDRAALVLMLLAPFLLTLGLGLVTGRFSGSSSSGVSNIPVVLVNQDDGQIGGALVDLFQSRDLADLVAATVLADPMAARRQVDDDQVAAAIIIPAGFSRSIIPEAAGLVEDQGNPAGVVPVELYTNPTRPTSAGVIRTILDGFMSRVEAGRVGGMVAVMQLLQNGLIRPQDAVQIGGEIGMRQAGATPGGSITLESVTSAGRQVQFDVLAYMAPGMALMFLMFTVSNGGRTLLTEQALGTLPRLLISPTSTVQVLAGKFLGIYLTGVAQMLILVVGCSLLFGLNWGDPNAVLVLILAAVAGAMGWGMLLTSLATTPGQASTVGIAITLTFGILGGSFISTESLPPWFQLISKVTPNAWGLDGFQTLARGGGMADITAPVLALLVMGVALFSVAVVLLNRRGFAQR